MNAQNIIDIRRNKVSNTVNIVKSYIQQPTIKKISY